MKRRYAAVLAALLLIAAALPGTNWILAPVDPALSSGEFALIRVDSGAAAAVAARASATGATDVTALEAIDVVTARLSSGAVSVLRADSRVAFIAADTTVSALGRKWRYERGTGFPSPGVSVVNAEAAWPTATGRGVTVALMDTGVAPHPDLAGSIVASVDFVHDGATQPDPSGHGTFVAGLIAAHGTSFKGVAPDAKIVSLRVLDQDGRGTMHAVLAAFDWLLRNRTAYGIRILNPSFGAHQRASYHRELLSGVVESAHFAGIAVVAAAGNDGPNARTVSMPGADPFVITAGSLADRGTVVVRDDRESYFSSRGPTRDGFAKPDVLAPGEHVVSLRVPGTELDDDWSGVGDAAYARLSGTSASSAMVAGIAALVRQARPAYTPTLVKGAIVAGARNVPGTPRGAADASATLVVTPARVNTGLVPSLVLIRFLISNGQVLGEGVNWEGIAWEGISWESVSWEGVAWESVSWDSVTWESVTWESVTSETVSREDE